MGSYRGILFVTWQGQTKEKVLDQNSVCREKNDEFSFSVKLMPKLMRLGHVGLMVANTVVLESVFSSKVQMP